jgi:uncharacterized protein (DUF4415 family)
MPKASKPSNRSSRGRADLARLRRMTDAEIEATSPPELRNLPEAFWQGARVVTPVAKEAISIRLDSDVVAFFREAGPRYQSRINAVLRSYVDEMRLQQGRRPSKRAV